MSHLPCYILSGLLALLLVAQQILHNRITTALHDRILDSKGAERVPEVATINKMIDSFKEKRTPYNQEELAKKIKEAQKRVSFRIPNMPEAK